MERLGSFRQACAQRFSELEILYSGENAITSIAMGFHQTGVATTESLHRRDVCPEEDSSDLIQLTKIDGGAYHFVGVTPDGMLFAEGHGSSYNGEDEVPAELAEAIYTDVSTQHRHNLAITENASVVAWGRNEFGQADAPVLEGIVDIECTNDGSIAVNSLGEVIFWGNGDASAIPVDLIVKLTDGGFGTIQWGCTDTGACNFQGDATADDGTCIYSCLFCGEGTLWSDSLQSCQPILSPLTACGEGTVWDEDSQTCIIDETYCSWQPDSDGDQLIGVSDLLMFLSVFGDTDLDQDGIFDSNDDCVGEYDECGVCNGSGPSIPIIESIEILYDSVYAEQIDEWWVFEVGADTTYSLICGYGCTDEAAENYDSSADTDDGSCLYPWACGDPLEYHGYDYETVQIGEQCWFAENLRAENYRNGEALSTPGGTDLAEGACIVVRQRYRDIRSSLQLVCHSRPRGLCPSG